MSSSDRPDRRHLTVAPDPRATAPTPAGPRRLAGGPAADNATDSRADPLADLGWDAGWAAAARAASTAASAAAGAPAGTAGTETGRADADTDAAATGTAGAVTGAGGADPGTNDADPDPAAAAGAAAAGAAAAGAAAGGADPHAGPHPNDAEAGGAAGLGGWVPGRVARADRGRALVATAAGAVHAALIDPDVTAGDWVLLDGDVVKARLPRRTAVVRGGGRKDARGQLLAANVDVVLVTVALTTAPDLSRLDRLLAVAWSSGAAPMVALTKADLCRTADTERDEFAEAAPGVEVVLTSVVDGRGLAQLRQQLTPGRTLALLGGSGVGKSSLVNALAGGPVAAVAPIRADGRGRHTTTARGLVVLPGLGVLLDTPGLRGVQLWAAEEALDRTFADVAEVAQRCRFRDCGHRGEPGCAVADAVAGGRLSPRRLDSFTRLQRENAWLQRRYDARLRAEQRRRWRRQVWVARHRRQP